MAEPQSASTPPALEVEDLRKHFPIRSGLLRRVTSEVKAVDGVNLALHAGQTLGLVGESGCGKTTTGRMLVRLEEPTGGTIRFRGEDVTHPSAAQAAQLTREVQIVFQDPYSSLSPRMTVQEIVAEPLRIQGTYAKDGADRVHDVLTKVGLGDHHANRYAHEFSGGQRQRIGIARALILDPTVLVLDEPVSALDVSVRAQVINQLEELQERLRLAYLFISHDLSVVRHTCERIAVMYLGQIVESATREQIFKGPMHPYTQALLSAIPVAEVSTTPRERIVLTGDVPSPSNPPSGCRFRTRCWKAQEVCASEPPPLVATDSSDPGHLVACHFPRAVDILGGESAGTDAPLATA